MAKPVKAVWTLPQVVHPDETVCYTVRVPKERFYIAAFLGAMFNLVKPYNWANDIDHTAVEVGAVWGGIFDDLLRGDCSQPKCDCLGGGCGDECMSCCIRFKDGFFETLNCGVWEKVPGQPSGGLSGPSQPPPGGDIPDGECVEYDVILQANSKWQLPVGVQNGDTITVTSALGGWSDGTINPWHCPDGNNYLLGICVPATAGFDGSDPVATAHHMELVALTDTQGYPAFNTSIGIVGTTGQVPLTFQANDSTLEDNAGSISFHVKVCRAAASPIGLTYTDGTGPSSVNSGDIVTLSSQEDGGNQIVQVSFSRTIKITVMSSNISVSCAGTCEYASLQSPPGTKLQTLFHPPSNSPTDFAPGNADFMIVAGGGGSTPFFMVVKIEDI